MSVFDVAYYLNQQQLLLLLSLIDQRPVCGVAVPEDGTRQNWQAAALSLLADGRVRYQEERLILDPRLGGLLLAMKDADFALAVYGRGPAEARRVLYMGRDIVCAEFFPDGGCRLGISPAPTLQSLVEADILPRFPMPEELEAENNETLKHQLAQWETVAVSLNEPPGRWQENRDVRGLVDRLNGQGERERWIWVDAPYAGLILHQDRNGIRARLDTQSRRQSLARMWRMEV